MGSKQKCPECEEGAPSWLVSYGDMTTLLLCFFVFLLVTAKVDVDKLSQASGYMARKIGLLPDNLSVQKNKPKNAVDDGRRSDTDNKTSIDDGKKFILGGREMFEKGQATPKMTQNLMSNLLEFAKQIRGLPNIIEVRGHAGTNELTGNGVFRDEMDLSLERARAIKDILVNNCRISENRIRLVGCSAHEKISGPFGNTEGKNRRVEVRVTEKFQIR